MKWCWEDLANAIVLQAVKDYRQAKKALRRATAAVSGEEGCVAPDMARKLDCIQSLIQECEAFFLSRWYAQLTDVDGEWLLETLKRERNGRRKLRVKRKKLRVKRRKREEEDNAG